MFPIICKVGPLTIYSYGLMLALAVIICTHLLARDAAKLGIKKELIYDWVFWLVVSGILGARIFYIFLNLPFFIENPIEIVMIQRGGLAFQGGFMLAALAGIVFVKKHKLSLPTMADLAAPYVALGQAIGRIGCFLNGCCYGKAIEHKIFPDLMYHPTQLYLLFGLISIFFILKSYQKKVTVPGKVFVLFMILEPTWRFVVEFFRADHDVTYFGLSIYQLVCLFLITIALYVNSRLKSHRRTP